MMNCPECGHAAHTRSSFQVSNETKERYNQCTNIECGHTFVTHETFVRSVCHPHKISAAPPHPKGMQNNLLINTDPPLAGFVRLVPP
ncbi:late control protein B [Salmonella enterica]|nr:late control protein B [Salmonella enterica]